MKALHNYERLTARVATMMATLICVLFLAVAAASAKTITVTGTGDTIAVDGVVTLREAITAANTNAPCGDAPAGDSGIDIINFNISGGGVKTISPTSALPTITEPITINGYSQPGASANTLAVGNNAVLLIELDGTNAGASSWALQIDAGNSTIRGLVINRFSQYGIFVEANGNNTIAGNYVGINAAGTDSYPSPNNHLGVYVRSANNTIGGITPADRNVVSGNGIVGPGGSGLFIELPTSTGNKVIGNYFGTDATGTVAIPNYNAGVILTANSNIIGGTTPAEGNLLSGGGYGVSIVNSASGNQVMGNFIGTKADGVSPLNNYAGINLANQASNNTIGGTLPGAGNVIASNIGVGVFVAPLCVNNAILGNSMVNNGSIGIDLYNGVLGGVTPNDNNTGDADTGANNLQNFPVLTSVVAAGGTTTIQGTLDSAFSTQFRIEFFSNTACDPSAFGEGDKFLGFSNVTTDASGKANFTFNVPTANVVGGSFTATATDPNGNTSEFSACAAISTLQFSKATYSINEGGGQATISVTRTDGTSGAVSVQYATVAGGTATGGTDYTPASGVLSWADGDASSKTFNVPIINDSLNEADETVNLTLSNPGGGAALGSLSTATLTIFDNDSQPSMSINNVSQAEGNSGTTSFTFNVTLSAASGQTISVNYTTADGSATAGSDYQPTSGSLNFAPGETSKPITVLVNGDTQNEPNETFFVSLSNNVNAIFSKAVATGTILNDDSPATPTLQFSAANYTVSEGGLRVDINVTRTGDSSNTSSVGYATGDAAGLQNCNVFNGIASPRCDYIVTIGTLQFAAGETSKSFSVPIIDDSYAEGNETFTVSLNNASGATLGPQSTATVTINDNDNITGPNPIDNTDFFVRQQYLDFLGREPDPPGFAGWTGTIVNCTGDTTQCDRIHVSGLFYQSVEFQQRGSFVYRFYPVSLGRKPDYGEFVPDLASVSGFLNNSQLEAAKVQFVANFMARPAFVAKYNSLSNQSYVVTLMQTAGVNLPNQQALIDGLNNSTLTRAQVLRQIAESTEVSQKYFHQAFAVMEYFGYLRRDPDAFYLSWIAVLDSNNDPRGMVNGFMNSQEYRQRFGP